MCLISGRLGRPCKRILPAFFQAERELERNEVRSVYGTQGKEHFLSLSESELTALRKQANHFYLVQLLGRSRGE